MPGSVSGCKRAQDRRVAGSSLLYINDLSWKILNFVNSPHSSMRFDKLFAIVSSVGLISGVASWRVTKEDDLYSSFGFNLIPSNKFNSPLAPWKKGAKPGWYYGSKPFAFQDIPCLNGVSEFMDFAQCITESPAGCVPRIGSISPLAPVSQEKASSTVE